MECFCFLGHVHDKMADGKTPFEKRCCQKFDGPSIPFGTLVEYIPITAKDKSRVHQFGKTTLNGLFSGYVLRAGGGWSGDFRSTRNWRQKVAKPRSIRKRRTRISACNRPRPSVIAEGHIKPEDKKGKTTEDSWRTSFLVSRPTTLLKYIDVMRQTQTSLNNLFEHSIIDLWTEAKGVSLSGELIGTTRFQMLRTRLREGYNCVMDGLRKSTRLADQTVSGLQLGDLSKTQGENRLRNGQKQVPNCKQHAATVESMWYLLTDDNDHFKVIADARLKLEKDTAPALPCCEKDDRRGKPQAVELSDPENTGARRSVKRQHTDHIAEYLGSLHYSLGHNPVSVQEAVKIPDAKAAVDKEWNQFKTIPALDVKKVRPKFEVIRQARKDWKPVRFANLLDLCHMMKAELAKHLQKYKVRVVLRGDDVKDEGYRAVFTVQGASESQMPRGRVLGHHLKASWYGWRTSDAISVYSSQNDRSSQIVTNAERRMSWNLVRNSSTTKKDQKSWNTVGDPRGTSWKTLKWSPMGRPSMGKNICRCDIWKMVGREDQHGIAFTCLRSSDCSCRFVWMI